MLLHQPTKQELKLFSNLLDEGELVAAVGVAERPGNVLGYGVVRMVPEFAMSLFPKDRPREKVVALKALLEEGKRILRHLQHQEALIFLHGSDQADLFQRHFHARPVDAIPMTIEVL